MGARKTKTYPKGQIVGRVAEWGYYFGFWGVREDLSENVSLG